MRLLLDTCALVALAEREPMRDEAVQAIRAAPAAGEIFVPAVIAFEVAQKMAVGKFTFAAGRSARAWFEAAVKRGRFRQLPVTADLALTVYELPEPFHEDPADRLIVAMARRLKVPVVTIDRRILDYRERGHVEVLAY